jgi:hypothetical protein
MVMVMKYNLAEHVRDACTLGNRGAGLSPEGRKMDTKRRLQEDTTSNRPSTCCITSSVSAEENLTAPESSPSDLVNRTRV